MENKIKKKHEFDEVFDGQGVFRTILEAMSNPGRVCSIEEQAEKMYGEQKACLAIAMSLLDNETTFYTEDEQLAEDISLLTLAKKVEKEHADFAFLMGETQVDACIPQVKIGTLEDPHKSCTCIVLTEETPECTITIQGPGVKDQMKISVSNLIKHTLDQREAQNYEYPEGVDMFFVTKQGRILCIPRLVKEVRA